MRFVTDARRALRLAAMAVVLSGAAVTAQEVNLYTTREPGLVKPLIDAFSAETGITVNTVFVRDGLPERVAAEGENSPADVLMTVDIGNLIGLVEAGVTQPVHSEVLEAAIPANLRDPDGNWFTVSTRARVLYASKDRVDLNSFTYEELADPEWKGRVCIRSGQHPYNTALFAAYLAKHGEDATVAWLRAIKDNLARKPGGGDRDVARDILGAICDIGIANSYYVGLMRSGAGGPEQEKWGEAIDVILPTFAGGGTHVNISGVAVAEHAPNLENAIAFLEFLVSDQGQELYAHANFEYPVKPGVDADPIVASFGALEPDPMALSEIAAHRREASQLVDQVGFDN